MIVKRLCSCERGANFITVSTLWQVFFEKIFSSFSRHVLNFVLIYLPTHMTTRTFDAPDSIATEQCGFLLGKSCMMPCMIALLGPMGAGKTHFSKGLARGIGYEGEVTSPTFSIVQEYHGGRFPIFHFDLYRIHDAKELLALGWDDYLDQDGILLVEWADRFPELWPENATVVALEITDTSRNIMVHVISNA
jgi:tRNA threonylcarbamoyladenosine biosynthesis protein TsaE